MGAGVEEMDEEMARAKKDGGMERWGGAGERARGRRRKENEKNSLIKPRRSGMKIQMRSTM
jgi:hypothetical protein